MLQTAAAGPASIGPKDATYLGGGGVLLADIWHQRCPYNLYCPGDGCHQCTDCGNSFGNANDLVGCVPLSGAQIMRHWCWPPPGLGPNTYSWANMPNTLACASSPDEISAVARLCRDVGNNMTTFYGCDGTDASLYDAWWVPFWTTMEDNYKDNFFFNSGPGVDREGSADDWWNGIVAELNQKQPVHYKMDVYVDGGSGGHAFVVDGWEVLAGSNHMVHVNYGWGMTNYAGQTVVGWVSLDHLSFCTGDEGRLFNVLPRNHIGPTVSGTQSGAHYFNQDASGANATFQAGCWLQFLPTVTVTNNGGGSDAIFFRGSTANPTRLLANGDASKGIRINAGALKLAGRGSLRLSPQVPPRYPHLTRTSPIVRVAWDRGYSDDETTVIEVSTNSGPWTVLGSVDASLTVYDDLLSADQWGQPRAYRLRSAAGDRLSPPSDVVAAW